MKTVLTPGPRWTWSPLWRKFWHGSTTLILLQRKKLAEIQDLSSSEYQPIPYELLDQLLRMAKYKTFIFGLWTHNTHKIVVAVPMNVITAFSPPTLLWSGWNFVSFGGGSSDGGLVPSVASRVGGRAVVGSRTRGGCFILLDGMERWIGIQNNYEFIYWRFYGLRCDGAES